MRILYNTLGSLLSLEEATRKISEENNEVWYNGDEIRNSVNIRIRTNHKIHFGGKRFHGHSYSLDVESKGEAIYSKKGIEYLTCEDCKENPSREEIVENRFNKNSLENAIEMAKEIQDLELGVTIEGKSIINTRNAVSEYEKKINSLENVKQDYGAQI